MIVPQWVETWAPAMLGTLFWAFVGIVLPFIAPKGSNRGLIQCCLMLTAATCWLFWVCSYIAQVNPLFGPRLSNKTILMIARQWDHKTISDDGIISK